MAAGRGVLAELFSIEFLCPGILRIPARGASAQNSASTISGGGVFSIRWFGRVGVWTCGRMRLLETGEV